MSQRFRNISDNLVCMSISMLGDVFDQLLSLFIIQVTFTSAIFRASAYPFGGSRSDAG